MKDYKAWANKALDKKDLVRINKDVELKGMASEKQNDRNINLIEDIVDTFSPDRKPTQVDLWRKELLELNELYEQGMLSEDEHRKFYDKIHKKIKMFERYKKKNGFYPTFGELKVV